jgi:hypothetical protein
LVLPGTAGSSSKAPPGVSNRLPVDVGIEVDPVVALIDDEGEADIVSAVLGFAKVPSAEELEELGGIGRIAKHEADSEWRSRGRRSFEQVGHRCPLCRVIFEVGHRRDMHGGEAEDRALEEPVGSEQSDGDDGSRERA